MTDDDPTLPVYIARNLAEADLIAGLLSANVIDAVIENEEGVATLDGIVSGNRGVTIAVRREDAEVAKGMIAESRALGRISAGEEE